MTPDEARLIVAGWLSDDYWDDERANGYDLTPIIEDIARVDAHLTAEAERIQAEAALALANAQARADGLPRRRYRMTREPKPPSRFPVVISHRVPIDCWSAHCYASKYEGCCDGLGHVRVDGVVHGDFIEVIARGEPEKQAREGPLLFDGIPLPSLGGCQCVRDAVVECTDEYLAHVRASTRFKFTPIPAAPVDGGTE